MSKKPTKPPGTNRGVKKSVKVVKAHRLVGKQSSTIDWLTVTTTKMVSGYGWYSYFRDNAAGKVSSTNFFGFDCVRDEDGLVVGQRQSDGRYIAILQGSRAAEAWQTMYSKTCNVSRVDLACDVWLDESLDVVGKLARKVLNPKYETIFSFRHIAGKAGGEGRPSTGETLYCGSRSSDAYGRVYDKGKQTKTAEAGRWFRYEVEYKDNAARQIVEVANKQDSEQLGAWVNTQVYAWFVSRGIKPVFGKLTAVKEFRVRAFIRRTTDDKKVAWLRSQVKPTVEYLFEMGLGERAIDALGLGPVLMDKAERIKREGGREA